MGGYSPLGYDAKDRSFITNKDESEIVKDLYEKFTDLKSITKLLGYAKTNCNKIKSGKDFSKNTLRQLLENPINKGYVSHKCTHYKGLHEGIIDDELFDKVQSTFRILSQKNASRRSLVFLKNIIRCGVCDCSMTPTYCKNHNRKYRYYTCSNHVRKKSCSSENKNLPAGMIEESVTKEVRKILQNPTITALTIHKLAENNVGIDDAHESLKSIDKLWDTLHFQEQQRITKLLIKNVVVENMGFKILLNPDGVDQLLQEI
jgi:hypothetical protein